MGTSTAPQVMNRLRDKLRERTGLAEIQVSSAPMADSTASEAIFFTDVDGSQDFVTFGGNTSPRDQTYLIRGVIAVTRGGAGEEIVEEVRERAYEIFSEVEDELRENPTLDELPGLLWVRIQDETLSQAAGTNERHVGLTFSVQVRARI